MNGPGLAEVSGVNLDIQELAVVALTLAETAFPTRVVVVNWMTAEAILRLDFLK